MSHLTLSLVALQKATRGASGDMPSDWRALRLTLGSDGAVQLEPCATIKKWMSVWRARQDCAPKYAPSWGARV